MRFLFTVIKSVSHFRPMLPFARGLQARGHDVRFAAIDEMAQEIAGQGFDHLVMAGPSEALRAEIEAEMAKIPPKERGKAWSRKVFAGHLPRLALPGLLTALAEWRPDVIIRETTEFTGLIAAQKLGIPHVRLEIVNGESEESFGTNYGSHIDALREQVSLPPLGPGYIADEPSFSEHPQVLDMTPRVNTRAPVRYRTDTPAPVDVDAERPEWLPRGDRPLVYATFGTVAAGVESGAQIYQKALDALADLPVSILLTTGRDAPPDLLGAVPENATVRPFVPQAEVFPHAALMLCHGGSGTVVAGLSAGLPLVIAPLFADQDDNARCLAERGLCRMVANPDPDTLREAVREALADPAMRERAQEAARDIAATPSVDTALDALLADLG